MKKLLVYFSLFIFSMILFVGCSENNKTSMTGIYLRSTNGSNIIIVDNNGPIVMSNETGSENVFDDLENGDKIEVTYDAIMETYPGRTTIYSCKLIEKGSAKDIPKDILDKLEEMGWTFDLSE
ncbi:MAG: hypothetical protein E6248_15445 [Clostridium sp.]|uniref:hypothetical protein n=1 Tax=Clostridium sp. TaxID=1506 RepID=UPI0029121D54|nr:hypothetical protein [Clostridium sp.]MDU5111832.1 hypothetical protein [Clostridium sp.]